MSAWGWIKGKASGAWDMVKDPFQGESVSAYEPNKENFKYGGKGEGFFGSEAAGANKITQADLSKSNESRDLAGASRAQLNNQVGMLDQLYSDQNKSAAYNQMRLGQGQNFQQALALARSGGGASGQAAAMRSAQQQQMGANQNTNLQAAALRAQEQQGYMAQRGQLLTQQRAMDLQAQGLDAQTAFSQAQLELGSNALNNQYKMGMYGLGQNAAMAQQKGMIGYEGMRGGNQMAAQIANAQTDAQRDGSIMGLGGAVLGAGIMSGWFGSDISAKTNVVPADSAQINSPLRPGPARSKTLATPATVGSEWQQGLNIPEAPSQEQVGQSQEYMQQMNRADDLAKRQIWANAVQNMTAPKGGQGQIDPMSFVNGGSYVDSDERVKDIQRENNELRSAIAKLRAMDEVDSNMRGAEDKSAFLDPQDTRVAPARRGLAEGLRHGVERAATAGKMEQSFSPEERQRIAVATRGPGGEPSSTDDQLDYARSILNWRKAEEDARRDRLAVEAAAQRDRQAEIERSGWRGSLKRDRNSALPVASNGYIDSDERTKTAVDEIRGALGKLQMSDSPYAKEFLDAANANMGVDFGAALDSAIAKARIDNTKSDLDQLERDATLDTGRAPAVSLAALKRGEPPPLRAGTTAVARFEDRQPSPSMGDRTGVKAALGDADLSRSKATDEFLASARGRMGGGDYEQALADAVSRHRLVGQAAQVPAIEYNYTPEAQARLGVDGQRYTGTTAQALERIPATAPSVVTDPSTGYKKVNTPVVTMANTAMLSDLSRMALEQEDRLRRLESKYGPLGRRGRK